MVYNWVIIQWLVCMQAIAMQTGHWISNRTGGNIFQIFFDLRKNMVELRNVSKAYKNNILFTNLNITVPRRDICGILGENGSGKSVLLKMICGFALPDAGEVFVGGERIEKGRFPRGHRGDPGFHRLSAGGDGAGQSAAPGLHPREGGQGISICCGQACEAAFMKKSIMQKSYMKMP
nr:ATP-binding cassette domain-containing protein [uncultured Acetatifactor sp.]